MAHDPHHHHPTDANELEETLHAHDDWFRHQPGEAHQAPHGELNAWGIIVFMAVTLLFVAGVSYVTFFYWEARTRQQLVIADEQRTPRSEYVSLKADWSKQLTSYEWADAAKGRVRIPLSEAKKLVIAESARRNAAK